MHAAHTCTQRTHARSAHMHAAHTCTQRTHARSAHMHAAHTCTQRTHARSAHMHAAHTCTQRTHARSAHMHAAHTCTQRTHARSAHMHAHTRIKCAPFGCTRTEGAVYEPRSEAESAPRKRKNKPSHEDAPSVHPFKPHFVRSLARSATLTLTLRSAPRLRAPFGRKKKKKNHVPTCATSQPQSTCTR